MMEKFLKKFDYCPDYGFVIRDPLERLEAYFDPWTELVLQLDEIRLILFSQEDLLTLVLGVTPREAS